MPACVIACEGPTDVAILDIAAAVLTIDTAELYATNNCRIKLKELKAECTDLVPHSVRRSFIGGFGGSKETVLNLIARKLFERVRTQYPDAKALVIAEDIDKVPSRRIAWEQIRSQRPPRFAVVIACPIKEVEAWHLCCYEPTTHDERVAFRPWANKANGSHLLPSGKDRGPTGTPQSAKAILAVLTADHPARATAYIGTMPADEMRRRGTENGLSAFIDEVEQYLRPLFAPPSP